MPPEVSGPTCDGYKLFMDFQCVVNTIKAATSATDGAPLETDGRSHSP